MWLQLSVVRSVLKTWAEKMLLEMPVWAQRPTCVTLPSNYLTVLVPSGPSPSNPAEDVRNPCIVLGCWCWFTRVNTALLFVCGEGGFPTLSRVLFSWHLSEKQSAQDFSLLLLRARFFAFLSSALRGGLPTCPSLSLPVGSGQSGYRPARRAHSWSQAADTTFAWCADTCGNSCEKSHRSHFQSGAKGCLFAMFAEAFTVQIQMQNCFCICPSFMLTLQTLCLGWWILSAVTLISDTCHENTECHAAYFLFVSFFF